MKHSKHLRWLVSLVVATSFASVGGATVWADDRPKAIIIEANANNKSINADGDGKLSERECWQFLYQNRPEQPTPRLAFLSARKGPAQIYVLYENGETKKVQLTPGKSVCRSPQLSPDGRWIAFHSQHDGKAGLFVVPSTGGEPRHLTNEVERFLGWQYAWSPDSKGIAFLAHPGKKGADIHVVQIATGKIARLTESGARSPAWSPDGKSIAYMTWTGQPHSGLCVMKVDGTDQRQLSSEGH